MSKDLETALEAVFDKEAASLPVLARRKMVRMVLEAVRDHAEAPAMMGTLQRQFEEIMAQAPSPRLPPMQQQKDHPVRSLEAGPGEDAIWGQTQHHGGNR